LSIEAQLCCVSACFGKEIKFEERGEGMASAVP